jgi:halogenation protein CepH
VKADGGSYDAVVIGGGPAGASTAIVLAGYGHDVLVLERERFPRFHIGESLLPAGWELWDRLGVTESLEGAGFRVKQGINFRLFGAPEDLVFLTAEFPDYFQRPYTYHVERARFDAILLDRARAAGAEVRQGWTVDDVCFHAGGRATVVASPAGAPPRSIQARAVIDASGRDCVVSRKLGWRKLDPQLNRVAHFAHFAGAPLHEPPDLGLGPLFAGATMTDVHTVDDGWLWYIPLRGDTVSVGAVLDARGQGVSMRPQERFDDAVGRCPVIREWLRSARQVMSVQTISSISYLSDRFVGDGFVLVGDASMFVDPIFSAGVTLALRGGIMAGETIHEGLLEDDLSEARLRAYEERIRPPMERIFRMIYNWYAILERKDRDNVFARARTAPLLRERMIVLFSGGYDRADLDALLAADGP